MTKNVEHICSINDKYCREGANPARHPEHDSHMGGCICSLGNLTDAVKSATLEASRKAITFKDGDNMVQRQYNYKVQGRGDFPWDMLRYDRVWPLSQPEPHRMESNDVWYKVRTVEVAGHGCTSDRWASFGWSVVDREQAERGVAE